MFRQLLSFTDAKRLLKQAFHGKHVGLEEIEITKANDRVLAQNIVAPFDIPPFTRSMVDGYAVKAVDTFKANEDNPVCFKVYGQIVVGESPKVVVETEMAAEIVTGAPLPEGADAVIMVENTNRCKKGVLVHRSVVSGENIMAAGSDIRKNEVVLKIGRVLEAREIGVLAALGLTLVTVYKRPKVAVMSTGSEIVAPGEPLPPGKIYDINAYTLCAAVLDAGGEPINLGIIPDNKDKLRDALKTALIMADVVITSGGVSVGPKDFTPEVINSLGKPGVIISGVAVKPGKPITIGLVDGKPVFSLPGNPTSSLFMFNIFVLPILLKFARRPGQDFTKFRVVAAQKIFSARGRRTFIMVNIAQDKTGRFLVTPVPTGLSGAITTLANADGFIEISEKQQFIEEGTELEAYLFRKK